MLAGRVKLKRFLLYAVGLGVVCLGALVFLALRPGEPEPDHGRHTPPSQLQPEPPPAAERAVSTNHLDRVLAYEGMDLGSPKVKDAVSGESWKVNLYQDEGHATVNRAKVDIDRDDKWDEKWTFADGDVQRQVSPTDDEQYTETWLHGAQGWYREGEESSATAQAQPAIDPVPAHAKASDPWVAGVMYYRGKDLGTNKLKDVSKGQAFKINVYQDEGQATANRAKVDIDRDDKWDQKWTFDASGASVKIAPNDDEDYSVAKRWTDQGWVEE